MHDMEGVGKSKPGPPVCEKANAIMYNASFRKPYMLPSEDPQPIVEEIARSRTFGNEEVMIELLRYLARNSYPVNNSSARGAREIAAKFHWQEESVSANIHRLQSELERFYREERNDALHLLTIHKGGRGPGKEGTNYLVTLAWPGLRPTRLFWAQHLGMKGSIDLVTNAPLFFRDRYGKYRVRVMEVNDKGSFREHVSAKRSPSLTDCEQCFHYVSIGDFRMIVALVAYFLNVHADINSKIVYSSKDLEDPYNPPDKLDLTLSQNIIMLGNPRVSWAVDIFQQRIEPNFFVEEGDHARIRNRVPKAGERDYYEDKLAPDGRLHAAVIRHSDREHVTTVLTVQNGPALEALASLLIDDVRLRTLIEKTGWKNGFPDYFELLFCIPIARKEVVRRADAPELLAWRNTHWRTSSVDKTKR